MENAAKALTIAGGVLIAIIVVSTLWYSFQQWGILPQAKADNEKISQEVEFNKEFESYNKQNLYGTDVITVINKAMANNQKYGIERDSKDPYYVNVKIKLNSSVYGYTIIYERDEKGEVTKQNAPDYNSKPALNGGVWYSLENDYIDLYNLTQNGPVKVEDDKKSGIRKEIYSQDEDFKLRYFECAKMEKHPSSGRICEIVFIERTVNKDKLGVDVFEVN